MDVISIKKTMFQAIEEQKRKEKKSIIKHTSVFNIVYYLIS